MIGSLIRTICRVGEAPGSFCRERIGGLCPAGEEVEVVWAADLARLGFVWRGPSGAEPGAPGDGKADGDEMVGLPRSQSQGIGLNLLLSGMRRGLIVEISIFGEER